MGTLVCRVELDKQKGLILTVENKEGKITQTAVLDGESITITSKGEKETSTITQKPDSIAIKCKDFTLESETITCKSTKDTLHKSEQKFDLQSTKDMTMQSEAKYTAKAAQDVAISGQKIAVSAKTKQESRVKCHCEQYGQDGDQGYDPDSVGHHQGGNERFKCGYIRGRYDEG